ncbi:LuxR family transcriptional regulator [Pseudofrankia sp. BMG5.36]|uniref:helix-turn-helix transcriptional regulator n=1 Tax=Pseudofrankia sp. BMG5.36 TaxID=1834512 RepID=UPI0008D99FB4|nr:LuxR family transcriptional regulator [Pseudofrankia sp. BMG5.36]OHV56806.1 hypothetical protein BCD48_07025 [Pseudofrankia sp. BMG5.36]
MRLVGRDGGLATIDAVLGGLTAARASRRSAFVRVVGEPGIGKSRLLAEATRRADRRGFLVVEGAAAEFDDDLAFAVFVDALDDYLAGLDDRALQRLAPAVLAHLGTVFPALEHRADGPVLTLPAERYRIHRAVRALLSLLAEPAPLVLVLDDVHWSDTASGELLTYLLAHPPTGSVLIAVGYRPAHLPDRLRAAFDRGHLSGHVETIELGPLRRADAELLAGAAVRRGTFEHLYTESGGNPFYLLELARAADRDGTASSGGTAVRGGIVSGGTVVSGGAVVSGGTSAGAVPAAVIAAIGQEIATLPDAARTLVHGAAVAGEPFDIQLAALAAGMADSDALSLVDQLASVGLVTQTDVPRRFAFRHPLVRRAVYESAGPGWRIEAHRRLADALRARGAAAVELAHHVQACAQPGDLEAVAALTAAGHAVASQAPLVAARRFDAALRLLPVGPADTRTRLDLLVALATSLGAAGQFQDSHRALELALAHLPAGEVGMAARLQAFCAAVETVLGLHDQARRRLRLALDALADRRSAEAATLMIELAADAHWSLDWPAERRWAAEAAAVARHVGDQAIEASALTLVAFSEFGMGTAELADDTLRTAATLADTMSDAEVAGRLDITFHLAGAGLNLEQFEQAVRHADRGVALARATGQGQYMVQTIIMKCGALRLLGRLSEAAQSAEEAVDSARLGGHDNLIAFALQARTWVATARGDLDLALASGQESRAITRRNPHTMLAAVDAWILGEAELEAGRPARCVAVVLDAAGGPDAERLPWANRCRAWHLLARADTERGRLSAAQEWIARLDAALPGVAPFSLPRAETESARAHLLLAQGKYQAAASAALVSAAAADRISARLYAARARLLAGRALAAAGRKTAGDGTPGGTNVRGTADGEGTVDLLERARTELELYGALRYRDEAARELRRLGVRTGSGATPQRGASQGASGQGTHDDALSPRERTIAALAAAGRTNSQIATELFLSTRTVERHLTHIFSKLDVSSRAQLGAVLQPRADTDGQHSR